MYVPKKSAEKYTKQELKGETDKSTIIAADFNTFSQQLMAQAERNSARIQNSIALSTYRIQPTRRELSTQQAEHTLLSSAHGTKITLILDHNTRLNKLKELKPYRLCFWTTMELTQKSTDG